VLDEDATMRCFLYSNQDEEDQDFAGGEEEREDGGIREDEEDSYPTTLHSLPLPCKPDPSFPFASWTLYKKNQEKHLKNKIYHRSLP
jgi:hypothetical protein